MLKISQPDYFFREHDEFDSRITLKKVFFLPELCIGKSVHIFKTMIAKSTRLTNLIRRKRWDSKM